MTSDYLEARIKALETELELTRKAWAEHFELRSGWSEETSLDVLDRTIERIKSNINKQEEDGKTSIQDH